MYNKKPGIVYLVEDGKCTQSFDAGDLDVVMPEDVSKINDPEFKDSIWNIRF